MKITSAARIHAIIAEATEVYFCRATGWQSSLASLTSIFSNREPEGEDE